MDIDAGLTIAKLAFHRDFFEAEFNIPPHGGGVIREMHILCHLVSSVRTNYRILFDDSPHRHGVALTKFTSSLDFHETAPSMRPRTHYVQSIDLVLLVYARG